VEGLCDTFEYPPAVRKWVMLAISALDTKDLRTVTLGGSSTDQDAGTFADTDLFLRVRDGSSLQAAEELRTSLQALPEMLVSTFSYRVDFGLRVRAAMTVLDCCSFFFLEDHMVRNTAHQRRGHVVWRNSALEEIGSLGKKLDQEARLEELTESLLEFPAAIKYLSRSDDYAASTRLRRAIAGLVNCASQNPDEYFAGDDANLTARLETIAGGERLSSEPPIAAGSVAQAVSIAIRLLRSLSVTAIASTKADTYAAFIDEAVACLSGYVRHNATLEGDADA
jgi:hypothetical protein